MIKKFFVIAGLLTFLGLSAQQKYTVVKGDNPTSIAKKYGMSLSELIRLNPSVKDGKIQVGQVLTVKGKAKTLPSKSADTVIKPAQTGKIILAPKQTIYGITKQYHISEAELRKLNPELDSHMKIGDEVVLPLENIKKYGKAEAVKTTVVTKTPDEKPAETPKATPVDNYLTYEVKEGDTVFGIMNKFGVTLDQLLELNPELSNGLKAGMTLKIKKQDGSESSIYEKKDNNALGVVLMLPFGFDTSESKYRSMALDFLSGAKLAIERNARLGQRLDVKIVDAGNETNFKNALSQINKDNTDLIIGPFFKSNILQVLDYVGSKKIPVAAPFANSEDLYSFNNLIVMETGNDVYADRIVKEVSQVYADQKIYILADADKKNAAAIESGLKKSLKKPEIIVVSSAQNIQLEKNMMTGQNAPVIAVLASDDDALGAAFSTKIIELSKGATGNKAFSMFYHPSFEKKVDELSQACLVYLMDRKVNTDGDFEKEILADYKQKYCKTPSKYAVIGFDVVNDMLTRENRKGEIFKQMGKTQTQLATKFEYVRANNNGAYINTGYRVVRLVP